MTVELKRVKLDRPDYDPGDRVYGKDVDILARKYAKIQFRVDAVYGSGENTTYDLEEVVNEQN